MLQPVGTTKAWMPEGLCASSLQHLGGALGFVSDISQTADTATHSPWEPHQLLQPFCAGWGTGWWQRGNVVGLGKAGKGMASGCCSCSAACQEHLSLHLHPPLCCKVFSALCLHWDGRFGEQ